MSSIPTTEDDRRTLGEAPLDSDNWDDATWAAWFRSAARAHGERFDGDTKPANPRTLLSALLHSARWAVTLTNQGQADEAGEHVDAIERLIAAYRTAVGANQAQVVGVELVVQIKHGSGRWQDFRSPFSDLFPEEGARQLEQARTGWPDREFRLVRRTTSLRVDDITDQAATGGGE